MIKASAIRELLQDAFPSASVTVENPRNDDKHFEAIIVYAGFKDKSLVDQHRMVHAALATVMGDIHALSIKTKVPDNE
jgi:stress-induced morphogen